MTPDEKLKLLFERLDIILRRQETLYHEVNDLRAAINSVKLEKFATKPVESPQEKPAQEPIEKTQSTTPIQPDVQTEQKQATPESVQTPQPTYDHAALQSQQQLTQKARRTDEDAPNNRPIPKSNLEKFIGENLINKIGIAITVLGVAVGAKYSIEHNLINPLTRIILGYLAGITLLGIGLKLKEKYENYSAVLVSGAIAIFYFITFAAYTFYALIPQEVAFILMFVFTTFGVVAANHYNKQVIAHIGLVGAYAVPFLLSDGSGKVAVLFSYMAIINIGILFIAYKKYWKPLYYVSFALTWLIYVSWFGTDYNEDKHFYLGLVFSTITFLTFYGMFLIYRLVKKETYDTTDGTLLLANSFIYYGIGYGLLQNHETGQHLLGAFTVFNAVIHFIVGLVIYKQKQENYTIFNLVVGLIIVFLTIAVPVQLDGNWITMVWALEAALLYWVGRHKNIKLYEYLSYVLMILAVVSAFIDWAMVYSMFTYNKQLVFFNPVFNINFLCSTLVIASLGFIYYTQQRTMQPVVSTNYNSLETLLHYMVPVLFIGFSYLALRMELTAFWEQAYLGSLIEFKGVNDYYATQNYNETYRDFGILFNLIYSMAFLAVLSLVNCVKVKNRTFGIVIMVLNTLTIIVFLTQGLYNLSDLRAAYIDRLNDPYHTITSWNLGIRYLSIIVLAAFVYLSYRLMMQEFMKPLKKSLRIAGQLALHLIVLWVLSSELLHCMDLVGSDKTYKLGLSILWGCYALLMIIIGIWKRKSYLRIGGMVLFGITIVKLFFYDISQLNTIAKTIVFVSLGVLLLISSFLYNKFKDKINDEHAQ